MLSLMRYWMDIHPFAGGKREMGMRSEAPEDCKVLFHEEILHSGFPPVSVPRSPSGRRSEKCHRLFL